MKPILIILPMLLTLAACDRVPEAVAPAQMTLDSPGRTDDNQWVVGVAALNPDTAEADARKQVSRKNCRLIALPGEPLLVPGGNAAPGTDFIIVGDAPANAKAPETSQAMAYAERYNAVVRDACK